MSRCSDEEILSSSPRVFGSMANVVAGSGKTLGGKDDRARLVAQRVAGLRLLQLRHGADVARSELRDRRLGLPLQQDELARSLGGVTARVVDARVGPHRARVDAEDGHPPGVRVHEGPEDERRQRSVRGRGADGLRLLRRIGPADLAPIRRRGQEVDDGVEERLHADVPERGGGDHGDDLPGLHGPPQAAGEVLLRERSLGEEGLDQVLVGLCDHLDELLSSGARGVLELRGDRAGLVVSAVVALERRGLLADQVDDPDETPLLPDRERHRDGRAAEDLLERGQRSLERGALAVHAIHDDQAREGGLGGEAPGLLGLDLDAGHRVDDDEGRVGRPQRRDRLRDEVGVARRVDQVQLRLPPLAEGQGGLEADLPLDLVRIEVRDGRPVVDLADSRGHAGVEEDCGHERCLSASAVADHGDVPDARRVENLHHSPWLWCGARKGRTLPRPPGDRSGRIRLGS